jgi:AcrR family transcriptional regulator
MSIRTLCLVPYPQKLSESQILDEAARLVDEAGIGALSMRTLATRLNSHAPSLYRYYPDKETLVRAVSTRFLDELAETVSQQETLAGIARAYWDYGMRHPNRYDVIVCRTSEAEQPPESAKFQVTEPLHALASRLSPENPLVVARVLWSYLHGAVSLRLAWPTREGLDPEAAFMAGIAAFEACIAEGAAGHGQLALREPTAVVTLGDPVS